MASRPGSERDPGAGVRYGRAFWTILGGALLVYLALFPTLGYKRDIYWFGTWMRTGLEKGVSRVSESVWCDYPPGYLYILKGIGFLWRAATAAPLPADESLAIRFLVKIVPILAGLAGAWVLYRMALPRVGRGWALTVCAAYALNPALLFVSGVWGQADAVTALLVLLAVWSLARGRSGLSLGLAAAATLVKFQAVVLAPVLLLGAWLLGGRKGLCGAFKGGAIAALLILLPFYWAHRVDSVIEAALGAVGRYPFLSMNAHNVWWLVGGAQSHQASDATRVGNAVLSYHAIGMALFGIATVLILWRLQRDLRSLPADPALADPAPALLQAASLQMLAFYLFPTQMHERYIVPVVASLAALCIWRRWAWWLYGALSVGILVSLASTLHATYPDVLGPLGGLFRPGRTETWALAVLFCGVFLVLFLASKDRVFVGGAPAIALLLTGLLAIAAFPPRKGPVRLCDWVPVEQGQGWGELHRDRSVDGHRLAVAGFLFRHGIGTHADSRLVYHLNGQFREFDTAFGVDDEAARGQWIRFRVLGDGRVLFDGGEVLARGWPMHVRVGVAGVEYLTLEVLGGQDGINHDHADWLNPTLIR